MQNIIQIGEWNVAVGLQWLTLPGRTSDKKEAAALAKDERLEFGVIFNAPNSTLAGLFRGSAKKGLISGAALLSQTVGRDQDLVLVEPVSETESWFCAIRNGAPLSGYDIVVSNEQIHELLEKVTSIAEYTVYSRGGEVPHSVDGDFLTLTQSGDEDMRDRHDVPYVVRLHGVPKAMIVGSVLVMAVFFAYFGINKYMQQKQKEQNAQLQQQQEADAKSRSDQALADLEASAKREMDKRLELWVTGQPSVESAVNGWLNSVGLVPASIAGWGLTFVSCKEEVCLATFVQDPKLKMGTMEDFVQAATSQAFTIEDIKPTIGILKFSSQMEHRSLGTGDLPETKPFYQHFVSQLQRLEMAGLKKMLTDPAKQTTDLKLATGPKTIESSWSSGTFQIDGQFIFEVRDSLDYMQFVNIAATTLDLDIKKQTWTLKGYYATK